MKTAVQHKPRGMRITLISPKGPLYRHRGGIWTKSLRYMPLTLPTLAALIPPELDVQLTCLDEGIQDVDLNLEADIVGMTVLTGSAMRAYELSRHFRSRGIKVVLGGPHVTLVPDDAQPHADAIVVGYAEQEWPRLLKDFAAGNLKPRYNQAPNLEIGGYPLPKRDVLPRSKYLTSFVFEANRGCIHSCSFCVVPAAWGRKPFQKPPEEIVEDIKRERANQAIFIDLNLISDREYAWRLFEAILPLKIQWYGLSTTLLVEDPPLLDLASRSGCRGLLMGLESINKKNLQKSCKGFNKPTQFNELVKKLHDKNIALQGCFVFGLDEDGPDVFLETARIAVEAKIDLPRFAVVTPFPATGLYKQLESEGRIFTKNWELYDGQHVVFQPARMSIEDLQFGIEKAWKYAYSWSGMFHRVRHTAAPLHVAVGTNLGYRYYAHRLKKFYTCDWMVDRDRPRPASDFPATPPAVTAVTPPPAPESVEAPPP